MSLTQVSVLNFSVPDLSKFYHLLSRQVVAKYFDLPLSSGYVNE